MSKGSHREDTIHQSKSSAFGRTDFFVGVSVQAQVLQLLSDLRSSLNLTYIFISHDLGIVRNVSEKILVMYLGKIVEAGPTERVIDEPLHPYTELLIDSMFVPDPSLGMRKPSILGEPNVSADKGCRFKNRCPFSTRECEFYDMNLIEVSEDRFVSCIRWKEINRWLS